MSPPPRSHAPFPPARIRADGAQLRRALAVACAAVATLIVSSCSDATDARSGASTAAATQQLVVGFIYVGSVEDHGYNEAAHRGAMAVKQAFPKARILEQENVPESGDAGRVMQGMIDAGASIIFPTSFGHLAQAMKLAARNPAVTFLHQGGLQTATNLGTYFGTIWETQYAAGQAAGMSTESNKIGFVAAFPIAQSLLSINAFQLGARSVNAQARTHVLFTSSWCDPPAQAMAAKRLLDAGADVLTQHQDCTASVIRAGAVAGARVVGYHSDASALAPEAWLTGSTWNWGPLYVDMVRTIVAGKFAQSKYASRYRGGLDGGAVELAPFGRAATTEIRRKVTRTIGRLESGELEPFTGPIRDQRGRLRIVGPQPHIAALEETDYLVQGVIGRLGEGAR